MSFRHSQPLPHVPSPPSSPPAPFVRTPRKGNSRPPSPPLSCSSDRFLRQDPLSCAIEYINCPASERLLLTDFSWADFEKFQKELNQPAQISKKAAESLRFDYNPETLILRIFGMPKSPHNALEDFLTKRMSHFARRNIITEAEDDELQLGFATDMTLPYQATTAQHGGKAPAFAKQPDAFFALNDNGESVFPRVVFEVGFSQSYAEVLDDVHQWLVRSDGLIPLAVLIFIEEHPIEHSPDDDGPQSDDSADSSASMYRRLRQSCDVDRYVGPLSAFAELFRIAPSGVYLVGKRINIISPPNTVPEPAGHIFLTITDLLPHIVDGRILDFDLDFYARGLQKSRGKLATSRVLEARKRRQQAAGRNRHHDTTYQPGQL